MSQVKKEEIRAGTEEFRGARSKPLLECSRLASVYFKNYFREVEERAAQGEPVIWLQVDCPQEICHAMGLPVFYPMHYSALMAAKQMSPYYLNIQNQRGYFRDLCRYCGHALGCVWDHKSEIAPWGGPPKPAAVVVATFDDPIAKVYELFAREYNVPMFVIDRTMWSNFPSRFWEDPEIEPHRLEWEVEQYEGLIAFLETITGKTLTETKLRQVVDSSNQQFGYFIKAMNMVAETVPCTITVADHMPNLICTNYFRGTEWALEHARRFYEEIKERVGKGLVACENEKIRLGWEGAAPWFSPGFLNAFEEKYGAVFMWLGYITGLENFVRLNYSNPLTALASRYLEYLAWVSHFPPTACSYYLHMAKKYKLNGLVFLVAESCKALTASMRFIQRELQAAGIATTEITGDIVDAREWDDTKASSQVASWIETLLT
jgi:benzoyl-CoA reductase/2-hydroxyglutaryl-CoA dehydratase subunit BcrC/BadD/HgdB